MRKQFTAAIFILCMVMIIKASPAPALQRNSEDPLLSRKIELRLKGATLMHVLSTLAVIHRVPIGIEYSLADQNQPKLFLESEHDSLRQVLDSIIKQEPLYQWEVSNGVINFVPIRERDPFFKTLVHTTVLKYDPGKWTIKFQLRDAIGNTPEVKRLLESNNKTLARYEDYLSYPSIYTQKNVDVSASNTTVREILNQIVRISEHKSWSISWSDKDKRVLSIRL
jgi:hypothetical protein